MKKLMAAVLAGLMLAGPVIGLCKHRERREGGIPLENGAELHRGR